MASLLGSQIQFLTAIDEKRQFLKIMGDRFQRLSSHDALILLCNSFAIPKLQYILRTSPCFLSSSLECYDETLREIVSTVSNIYLHKDGPAWLQGILPVTMGGLSICRAVDVAPSSFLASTSSTADIVRNILPVSLQSLPLPFMHDTLSQWSQGQSKAPPEGTGVHILKCWDHRRMCATADMLLVNAPDDLACAHLLAASTKESGAWPHALPITSLGLRMNDTTLKDCCWFEIGHYHMCFPCLSSLWGAS